MLLALVLAQTLVPYSPTGPIYANPASSGSLGFFEFAPVSGAGIGGACPLPNWLLQSDDFTTTWTQSVDSAPRNITITVNADGVADRLQIPATTPPAQYSRVFQGISTGWSGGTVTCSVAIKGTSGSGTIPVYALTGFPANKTICSFNSTAYTTCSLTWTSVGAGADNFYIGPSGVAGDGSFPVLDVLLKNAQCNAGSTVAPYVATTTAAKGYTPTGAKGETLTYSRASTGFCTKTSSGGLVTSGISNGDLVLMPNDQLRVEYDQAGVAGYRREDGRTNAAARSQELNDAVWQGFASGSTLPVVTANAAVAPDGTTTAERIDFGAVTSGADESTLFQTSAALATQNAISIYVRGVSGSGTIYISQSGASCVACPFVSTSWSRCVEVGTPTLNHFNISNAAACAGGAAAAVSAYVWGAQQENAAASATSYIATGAASAVRSPDTLDYAGMSFAPTAGYSVAFSSWVPSADIGGSAPPGITLTTGVAGANITTLYHWPFTNGIGGGVSTEALNVYTTASVSSGYAGTLVVGTNRVSSRASLTNVTTCLNGSCLTGPAATYNNPTFTRIQFGYATSVTTVRNAIISRVAVCHGDLHPRCFQ